MTEIEIQQLVFCPRANDDVTLEVCEDCKFHRGEWGGSSVDCGYGEEKEEVDHP